MSSIEVNYTPFKKGYNYDTLVTTSVQINYTLRCKLTFALEEGNQK